MARPRLRRIAHIVLKCVVGLLVGVAALVVLALASLDLPPVRAFVAKQANSALATSFRGRLTLKEIGHIDLGGVSGVDLEVADPAGNTVISAKGVEVALAWPALVYAAVRGADPLVVEVNEIGVRELRVRLIDDGTGSPTIARAFEPQKTEPKKEPGGETQIRLESIEIASSTIQGSLADSGPIDVGLAKFKARFGLDSKSLDAALDHVEVRARSPQIHALNPATLRAKVKGAFDDLKFEAGLRRDTTKVDARGRYRAAGKDSNIDASLDAAGINLASLLPDGPATQLAAHAEVALALTERGGGGDYRAALLAGSRFEGQELPETRIEGKLELPKERPVRTSGAVDIDEAGAKTRIDYEVRMEPAGVQAEAKTRTEVADPPRLQELGSGLRTSGVVETSLEYDAGKKFVNAGLSVKLDGVVHPSVRARSLDATAFASGDPASPKLRATLSAAGLSAAGRSFSSARVTAEGTPERIEVAARLMGGLPELIEVRATVAPGSQQLVESPRVTIANEAVRAEIRTRSLRMSGGVIEVDGLTIDGVGHAEASLRYAGKLERADVRTKELRPASVLRLLGVESELSDALLDLEASFDGRKQKPKVEVRGAARDITLGRLKGGTARIDLALADDQLTGEVEVAIGEGANTRIQAEKLRIPRALTAQALSRINGSLTLEGELDLRRLQPMFPMAGIERADGRVRFDVALERQAGEKEPSLRAKIASSSLLLVGQRASAGNQGDASVADEAAPWTLRGLDLDVTAEIAERAAKIAGRVHGKEGELVSVDAEWRDISLSRDLLRAQQALMQAPFTARVHVPPRALERLPAPIRPTAIRGTLALDVEASGTLTRPKVKTRGTLVRFGPATERQDPRGLDIMLDAEYDQSGGNVWVQADGRKRGVLRLDSRWRGDLADFANAAEGRSPVRGELELELDEFPVVVIPTFRDRKIRGKVSGLARVDGFGENARVELGLLMKQLKVDRMTLDKVEARVRTKGDRLEVEAALAGAGGEAGARVTTGIEWGSRAVPVLDQNVQGTMFARRLSLAALKPLVEGSVSELDGRLDAEVRAEIENGTPRLSGKAALTEGVLQLPAIGQRFHGITANVDIKPDRIRLTELVARGSSGRLKAHAEAKLDRMTPVAMTGTVRIREEEKLPITLEGESIGDAYGSIVANYKNDPENRRQNIHVNVRRFVIELPEAPPQGIQELDQNPHVRVGFRRNDGKLATIPLQPLEEVDKSPSEPTTTTVVVDLGSVRVVKGLQAEVALGGQIRATMGERLDVRGQIETRRGTLDISGKEFEIERGTVSFTGGAPDNPTIDAVARYDSPAGYTVYAEYTGTAKVGKLRLSSEPALSQDEILTLLLFGTPDGSFGGGGNSDSLSTAVSVAGGTAAKGLNRALSDVTALDVSARIDTSTGAPRPELVVQLTPRVSARVTQAIGEPTPGQSPDRTFLTVEFRFARAWSLSTMVGDRGASALDLVWRNRY